jgi:hypothetical protein
MPSLLETQRDMARHMLGADGTIADAGILAWIEDDGLAAADRAAIHRNTFAWTIANALRITYPAVDKLVGETFFDAAARLYLAKTPPCFANLDQYGEGFAEFLAGFPPAAALSYLPDVAALEWAVACVARAPDAPVLDPAALFDIDPAILEQCAFTSHEAAQLLETRSPADEIWRAVLSGDDDALGKLSFDNEPIRILVCRRDDGAHLRRLSLEESRVTAKLLMGVSLREAFADAEVSLATALLPALLAAGIFTRIRIRRHIPPRFHDE